MARAMRLAGGGRAAGLSVRAHGQASLCRPQLAAGRVDLDLSDQPHGHAAAFGILDAVGDHGKVAAREQGAIFGGGKAGVEQLLALKLADGDAARRAGIEQGDAAAAQPHRDARDQLFLPFHIEVEQAAPGDDAVIGARFGAEPAHVRFDPAMPRKRVWARWIIVGAISTPVRAVRESCDGARHRRRARDADKVRRCDQARRSSATFWRLSGTLTSPTGWIVRTNHNGGHHGRTRRQDQRQRQRSDRQGQAAQQGPETRAEGEKQELKGKAQQMAGKVKGALGDDI
ncbi:hypothetical protein DdX_22242 [Ditylenchus destructor]|uniref:Uncharacterized protein n=1 Tax=Ditylenchus destructor TaxID=166010 RepID=A0AAD4MEI6_9BILA|nr:hypothetical protein DdX_22242 [Ditylenchus destructor]